MKKGENWLQGELKKRGEERRKEEGKTPPPPSSEEWYRNKVRKRAREYEDQEVLLEGETIGIACAITEISDPRKAIRELVESGLGRWARLEAIDTHYVKGGGLLTKRGPRRKQKKTSKNTRE